MVDGVFGRGGDKKGKSMDPIDVLQPNGQKIQLSFGQTKQQLVQRKRILGTLRQVNLVIVYLI